MKGKLPVTHIINLESEEPQWRMLINGLINELKTTGTIEKKVGQKVRINLLITSILPPEKNLMKNIVSLEGKIDKNVAIGISKSKEFFYNLLEKTCWIFIGYIEGNQKVPILIIHYQSINMTVYTQKLTNENQVRFFPELN